MLNPTLLRQHKRHVALVGVAVGTRIDTPLGEVPVEELIVGDRVLIAGGGVRRISRIGRLTVRPSTPRRNAARRPFRIAAGALGDGLPHRDLLVAPQQALRLDTADGPALVPTRLLANLASIRGVPVSEPITYIQLAFAEPTCILAEGIALRAGEPVVSGLPSTLPPAIAPGPTLARLTTLIDGHADLPPAPLRGFGEIIGTDLVGWAMNRGYPDDPTTLELLIGDSVIATTTANLPRNDIRDLTGNPACGFSLPIPRYADDKPLTHLTLRRKGDNAILMTTMVLLDRPPPRITVQSLLRRIDTLRTPEPA